MLMRRFTFTVLSFVFLLLSLYAEGMLFTSATVSPETPHRVERVTVKQGVSRDGSVAVAQVSQAPQIPPREKISNGPRTLRAFIGANSSGVPIFFIESVKPHEYYSVTGPFSVALAYPNLMWANPSVLVFYVLNSEHILMRAQLDVQTLVFLLEPVNEEQVSTATEPFDLESIL